MRRETFTENQPLDYELFGDLKAAVVDVLEDLDIQVTQAGYKPLWQTLTITTEEYSVDDVSISGTSNFRDRYNLLTAQVMGVKE